MRKRDLKRALAGAFPAPEPVRRRAFLRFETKAPWWAQILKCLLGLAVVMGLRVALKAPLNALFGGRQAANAVRYMLMVLAAVLVWPLTFKWFAKGCPLGRRGKKALKIALIVLIVLALRGMSG